MTDLDEAKKQLEIAEKAYQDAQKAVESEEAKARNERVKNYRVLAKKILEECQNFNSDTVKILDDDPTVDDLFDVNCEDRVWISLESLYERKGAVSKGVVEKPNQSYRNDEVIKLSVFVSRNDYEKLIGELFGEDAR